MTFPDDLPSTMDGEGWKIWTEGVIREINLMQQIINDLTNERNYYREQFIRLDEKLDKLTEAFMKYAVEDSK